MVEHKLSLGDMVWNIPILKSYKLKDGSFFEFQIPLDGLTTKDVKRIAQHLNTFVMDKDESECLS